MAAISPPEGFYDRLWTPIITLWYLIWQWLQADHTLQKVVTEARRGGADRLCPKDKPLSQGIKSKATTAYSNARQRLPLDWVKQCFAQLSAALLALGPWRSADLPAELLDGSTKRMRPHGTLPKEFPPHRTRAKNNYWCVARVVVSFCAATGLATAARIASLHVSEQALAAELILERLERVLYIADRNFGVWRVVRAVFQRGSQALVRLTRVRARRLLGKKRLPAFVDQLVLWSPTARDQVDPGLLREPVPGRLLIAKGHRRGFRPRILYLFTTLTDREAYPPEKLLELYGWRWRVELDYRTIKSSMQMAQSEAKTPDMVRKEFYAGLMAYNLVRGLMAMAAEQGGCQPAELSFTKVHGLLASVITELFMFWMSTGARLSRLEWLLQEAVEAKLPKRKKRRQNEPQAQYYEPQVFPKMKGSRQQAREALKNANLKN